MKLCAYVDDLMIVGKTANIRVERGSVSGHEKVIRVSVVD